MRPVCTYLSYKQKLDADLLSNYRRISNLHTISKIVERVFMTSLAEHVKLSLNYNRFQSAYSSVFQLFCCRGTLNKRRGHSRNPMH